MNEQIKILNLVKMFHETKTIESQLPINLGTFVIAELLVYCSKCAKGLGQDMIHGYANQPVPMTASFHAVGICHDCEHITESVNRFKKVGEHTIRHEKLSDDGKWLFSEVELRTEHWLMKAIKKLLGLKHG